MDKKFIFGIVVAVVVAIIGGYMYADKQKQKSSISLSIGDSKISISAD